MTPSVTGQFNYLDDSAKCGEVSCRHVRGEGSNCSVVHNLRSETVQIFHALSPLFSDVADLNFDYREPLYRQTSVCGRLDCATPFSSDTIKSTAHSTSGGGANFSSHLGM